MLERLRSSRWTSSTQRSRSTSEKLASVDDEPVLLEMEAWQKRRVSRSSAASAASCWRCSPGRSGAKRIFEMGSGYGYSAYWFSRATGPDGEIHLTDMDPREREAGEGIPRTGRACSTRSTIT